MSSEVESSPKNVQETRMEDPQFLVQWDEHPSHLATRLGYLLEHQSLVDVTLMCNTHTLKVHRAVLAACSPYFERQLGNHPLIVLKDMKFSVLKSLVEFMYCGETSVSEENLAPLLEAARFFEVKGLTAMTKEAICLQGSSNSTSINGTSLQTPNSYRGCGRGRGRGRGRPPLTTSTKIRSPTESAQILLSLSGNNNQPQQQFLTTSKNVKIDPSVIQNNINDKKNVSNFEPRRRGRRRGAINSAFREKLLREADTQQAIESLKRDLSDDSDQLASPLLSSLLTKTDKKPDDPTNSKYLQTLKDFGLPTNVPILLDNGEGKLVTLTEDVLKSVMDSEGNVQFHVAEGDLSSSSGMNISDGNLSDDKKDDPMLKKQKKPRPFVVKEMQASRSDEEDMSTQDLSIMAVKSESEMDDDLAFQEEILESLKQGAASEAEMDPEAVVLLEVTGDKKVEKCVVSAREVNALKLLNEQLTKQKKQLADMTKNNVSTIDVVGTNTKLAELKLKIGRTKSILQQVMERAQQGLREKLKNYASQLENCDDKRPQSQVVQLEFIDGNGEKIEGYQVEGTVMDKRLGESKDSMSKDNDLLGLFDMVCDNGNQSPLMGVSDMKRVEEEKQLLRQSCGLEPSDSSKDMSYHQLVMNNHLEDQSENIPYDQLEAMIGGSDGSIVIEHKSHQDFKYVIDNGENMHDNYVVYDESEKQMSNSEYVIYGNTDTVLSGITDHEAADNFVVEDEAEVIHDETTEYIVYGDDKSDLGDMKEMDTGDVSTQYIVYAADDHTKAGKYEMYKEDDEDDVDKVEDQFVIYSGEKDSMLDALSDDPKKTPPSKDVPFSLSLSPLKDGYQSRRTRSSSPDSLSVKRHLSPEPDKALKKEKLDLVYDHADSESL